MTDDVVPPVTPTPAPAPQPAPAPAPVPVATVSKDEHDRKLGDARADAAQARQRARAAEEEKAAALAAAKTATDEVAAQIKAANDTATARIKIYEPRLVDAELKLEATRAGLEDLDLLALIKRDGVKINEDGTIVGVAEAVAAFKTSKPAYFKAPASAPAAAPAAPSGAPAPAPAADGVPPANVKDLSKDEYAKRRAESLSKLRKH